MTEILALDIASWKPSPTPTVQHDATSVLEGGGLVILPNLAFAMRPDETRFLSPAWSDGKAKNISLDGSALKGARGTADERIAIAAMVARFATCAGELVTAVFPRYAAYVKTARTSFRPQAAVGRAVSWRKDDSRLHVDAFPSRPNHGDRILRVFCNVNPSEDRVWRVGERFEAVATTFLPKLRRPLPGAAQTLAALRVTKGERSEYDHLMLGLHDRAKSDLEYQATCSQQVVRFSPGTTWLCFSDQVMHAAVSGQHMFEQTINLPITALYDPTSSPLAILERLCERRLLPAD
jgi:hypothetical protein